MGIILLSIIVTTVLVFTGLFLLFKKYKTGTNPLSNASYWITSFVAAPVVYLGIMFLWFFVSSYYEPQNFNKDEWSSNKDIRYVYVDDLIEQNKLIGLTCKQLKSMLGEADYEDDSLMNFYIGYSPKYFLNMDPDWLVTELSDGKVSLVYIRE